jgi:hypothetical protein
MFKPFKDVCFLAIIAAAAILPQSANAVTVLKALPAAGALKHGTFVLVDNGTCPKGEILRVTAGNNIGSHTGGMGRSSVCIPWR